jgi:hypothetical protein
MPTKHAEMLRGHQRGRDDLGDRRLGKEEMSRIPRTTKVASRAEIGDD